MFTRLLWLCAWATLLAACDSSSPTPPAPRAAASTNRRGPAVVVRVNGEAREVPHASLTTRADLSSVLSGDAKDVSKWKVLRASGAGGARLAVDKPAERLRNREVALYRDQAGTMSVGVFRTVSADAPPAVKQAAEKPSLFVRGVEEIEVWTVEPPKKAAPPPKPGVPLTLAGTNKRVDVNRAFLMKLRQVPKTQVREALVGGRRNNVKEKKHIHPGWSLKRVVRALGRPRDIVKVTLEAKNGRTIELTGEELTDKQRENHHLLLLNERDALNYHGLPHGEDAGTPVARARDLVAIIVESR